MTDVRLIHQNILILVILCKLRISLYIDSILYRSNFTILKVGLFIDPDAYWAQFDGLPRNLRVYQKHI